MKKIFGALKKNINKEQISLWKKSKKAKKYLWGILIIILLCLGFGVFHEIQINRNVVAIVNGEKVTLQQIKEEIADYPKFYRQFIKQNPNLALEDYIDKKILLQKAKNFYWSHREKINRKVKDYKDQLIIKEFLDNEMTSQIKIPSEEIKTYYNAHLTDFFLPERIHLYEIVVPTKTQATDILKRLSLGESFSDIAKKESVSSTAQNGGDMGLVTKSQLYPNLADLVFKLKRGQILDKFIKTSSGYHIIKVGKTYPPKIQTLQEAAPLIKNVLATQAKKQLLNQYINQLRKRAKIKIYSKRLKNI
ncbi:MAG: peptidylprolyl isomerase [Candidatus Omnitrophica bacterium]|jgi:parvulin-like peptidyl-prolyl isomerase|nr:peptidylprolyl isomerase [Candidatus Omnitrophota bacterium]